jgi:hypothetical protein
LSQVLFTACIYLLQALQLGVTFHENTIDHFINKYEMNMFISLLWRDNIGGVMGDQVKHDYKIGIPEKQLVREVWYCLGQHFLEVGNTLVTG